MNDGLNLTKERALQLVALGMEFVNQQRLSDAKALFAESLTVYSTPEGLTYLGWMLFYEGMTEEAIGLCKQAVELDPEFGNAYNDIGSYLMQLDRLDEAIPWLEKAKSAKRYGPRQFPYLNLGRLYLRKGQVDKAEAEYLQLLELDPENEEARMVLDQLDELHPPVDENTTFH